MSENSDCCDTRSTDRENMSDGKCPQCQKVGTKVSIKTPKHLLDQKSVTKISDTHEYKYCKSEKCEVSYFSSDPLYFFNVCDLKVKATAKDSSLEVNICYCFGYTRQNVVDEVKTTGETTVISEITAKMKKPGCFCETSNPQGQCCLSNVKAWVKEVKSNN